MKILTMRLKNFSIIKSCFNQEEIIIDFKKSKNIIQLFQGPSGSGKTGIVSCIHPFAYNQLDVDRPNSDLIVSGVNGEKELIYLDGQDIIKINHFYEWKSGKRLVKSFISLNDNELNENGNVTSFNELIKLHFGITPKALTLLRLGNNVKSLVNSSYTERKDYVSSLMSELAVYLQYHKKVTEEGRYYNSLLKNCIDKISRLHIENEVEIEDRIEAKDRDIRLLNGDLAEANKRVGAIKYKLEENDYNQLLINQRNNDLLIVENRKIITKYHNIIEKNTVNETMEELLNQLNKAELEKNTNETVISMDLAKLNSLYQSKEDATTNLGKVISKFNKKEIEEKLTELYEVRNNMSVKQPLYDYSEEELFKVLTMAQDIYNNMKDIDGIDRTALVEVINNRKVGINPDHKILAGIQRYQDKINYVENRMRTLQSLGSKNVNDTYIMYTPPECKIKECPYKAYYEDMNCENQDEEMKKLQKEVKLHKISLDLFNNMYIINQKLGYILMILKSNEPLFRRGAKDKINKEAIFQYLTNDLDYYHDLEVYFTEEIDIVHKQKEYEILNEDIERFEKELELLKLNSESIEMLENRLNEIEKDIHETTMDYDNRKEMIAVLESNISELNHKKLLRESYEDAINNLQEVESKLSQLTMDERNIKSKLENLSSLKIELNKEVGNIQAIENNINYYRKEIEDLRYRIIEFRKLKEEQAELESEYEKIKAIKRALSSKEGLPLLYQNVYLKDTTNLMNQLLDIAYNGELRVEPFEIDEKEFRIPFRRHGVVISDISAASQGETSMIVAALSFALIKQSLYKYNIIILDEIDGPLDESLRSRFLEIIESVSNLIDAEQVFVISHNNTYNNYPVDLICTGETKLDFKSANVIFER